MSLLFYIKSFLKLLKTAEFSKGIQFGVAAVLPLLVSAYFDLLYVGVAMAVGVLLTSPSDVPGSLNRRVIGVSFSVLIAVVATIIAGYAATNTWIFIPVLIVLMFSFSMISVYGFRASLIAFSGLFAVVLSMAQVPSAGGIIGHALLIGCGGLWYLGLTVLIHSLNRRKETEVLLAEVFEFTAEYLEKRTLLLSGKSIDAEELHKDLIDIQTALNEKHETMRELLISRRRNSGRSGVVRKRLLIFIELVDILELGMANPVNNQKMQVLFAGHFEKLEPINQWSLQMAAQLRIISKVIKKREIYQPFQGIHAQKVKAWQEFENSEEGTGTPEEREALLVYRNLLTFKEKQYQKLLSIERLLRTFEEKIDLKLKRKDAVKFLTTQDYDLKTLEDNLDFKSPIFRHSLRLTVILVAGFLFGKLFEFQNSYWILLTTLVIMRPGYALTRDRFKQRLYGTLIGGAIAVSIVLLVQNRIVYASLAAITLVLAFSMIQKNYKTAAAFITLNVVFVYSFLRPDVLEVIQFRVLDTIVGAGLAFVGNKFLWPTWEYSTINKFITNSIQSNWKFLKEIDFLYRKKDIPRNSYRLARKAALLAIGDLNAAFQRMAQEPKTSKEQLGETFRIVSLNQEFLSSTASLGTYIRSHATTAPSRHFDTYIETIQKNLGEAEGSSQDKTEQDTQELLEAEAYYADLYGELSALQKTNRENHEEGSGEDLHHKLQEVQIIMDQLKWLLEISENLKKRMHGLKQT